MKIFCARHFRYVSMEDCAGCKYFVDYEGGWRCVYREVDAE